MATMDPSQCDTPGQKRALSTMSKKRFHNICELLHHHFDNTKAIEAVIDGIKEIMQFDPAARHYTPEIGRKESERKRRVAKEKGTTTYALFVKPYKHEPKTTT